MGRMLRTTTSSSWECYGNAENDWDGGRWLDYVGIVFDVSTISFCLRQLEFTFWDLEDNTSKAISSVEERRFGIAINGIV